jgi:hypothetical protein
MLIHEPDSTFSNFDRERRWTEWSTVAIVVATVCCVCIVAGRGIPVQERGDEPEEIETTSAGVSPIPSPPSIDPKWEPSDEIVFRGVYQCVGVFVKGVSDKGGCALGYEIDVKQVLSGRLGVKRLWCRPPAGVKSDQVYTFRWKPSDWARADLKSANKKGYSGVSLMFWDSLEVVKDDRPKP